MTLQEELPFFRETTSKNKKVSYVSYYRKDFGHLTLNREVFPKDQPIPKKISVTLETDGD